MVLKLSIKEGSNYKNVLVKLRRHMTTAILNIGIVRDH